jgi:hypothetical protein
VFFKRRDEGAQFHELGVIEMNAEMNLTPYKTLVKIAKEPWEIVGIEHLSLVLLEGDASRDKKLTFYRIPFG